MEPLTRITAATIDVLSALIDGGESVWGLQVIKQTGRPPGSVYPILDRLERSGWVHSEWETDNERSGPRRRFYALTAEGADAARAALESFAAKQARTGAPASARSHPALPMAHSGSVRQAVLRANGATA